MGERITTLCGGALNVSVRPQSVIVAGKLAEFPPLEVDPPGELDGVPLELPHAAKSTATPAMAAVSKVGRIRSRQSHRLMATWVLSLIQRLL
jgi:hypothetical protein